MDEPIHVAYTACTLSQYQAYNRAVQRIYGKLHLRIGGMVALDMAIGILFALMYHQWWFAPVFFALGGIYAWSTVKGLRKAEMAQYQQEQLAGTITYRFFEDRMTIETHDASSVHPYGTVSTVLESKDAYYIMFSPNSGAILPKSDCTPVLEGFIRERLPVRTIGRCRFAVF